MDTTNHKPDYEARIAVGLILLVLFVFVFGFTEIHKAVPQCLTGI